MTALLCINPRFLTSRLVVLGAAFTLVLVYAYSRPPAFLFSLPKPFSPQSFKHTCSPESYSNGSWAFRPRTNPTSLTSTEDALALAGVSGCASSREYDWHLATDRPEQWDRFPDVTSWEWLPGDGCTGLRPFNPEALIKDMVEGGGWLLVGDSVTENHFFSISCTLHPHVIATPDYTSGASWDRGWPQNLYLKPDSPLVNTITFPPDFNISSSPLVTFRRIDILFSQGELNALYHTQNPHFSSNDTLFSEETVWTLPIYEYLDIFFSPANYGTMVVSTGGHWTTTLFSYFRDESKKDSGYGIESVLHFFEVSMQKWASEVQMALWKDEKRGGAKRTRKGGKRVVIRAYLPGHEDCHSFRKPWAEVQPFVWNWYNWGNIWDFNLRFEKVLSAREKYPNIYFLPIDRPARLRPDAHATGDCLHIMTGAGVLEGWTHYIWQFITHEY